MEGVRIIDVGAERCADCGGLWSQPLEHAAMPTKTEAHIADILGWTWLVTVILALVYGGAMSLAVVTGIGIAAAAAYLEYKYQRHPELFLWKGR